MGIITTFAGNSFYGHTGDGGQATAAELEYPYGIAIDLTGNIYFTDGGSGTIRKINIAGIITTIAGNGSFGYSGDGGPATSAEMRIPGGIAINNSGDIFFTDWASKVVRKINNMGIITTIAGNGVVGNTGDGGEATNATLNAPNGVNLDGAGNIYISDNFANVVRKVDASGIISTVVRIGTIGFSGDGGPATSAQFNRPILRGI